MEKVDVLDHGFVRLVDSMGGVSNKTLHHREAALPRKVGLLHAVRECGEIRPALRRLGISTGTLNSWRRTDAEFVAYLNAELAPWRGVDGVRICRTCLEKKPYSEFEDRSDRPNQRTTCRACKRIQDRASYQRNKADAFFRHKASRARSRSTLLRVPCNVTAEYLERIWTGVCPVFGTRLNHLTDRGDEMAPELDRLVPSHGYVVGNVAFLSRRANRLKNNVAIDELKILLAWLEQQVEQHKCAA